MHASRLSWRKAALLSAFLVAAIAIVPAKGQAPVPARPAGVSAWELPPGAKVGAEARDGWKPAVQGSEPTGGLALENKQIVLVAEPGTAGPVLYVKGGDRPPTRVELLLQTDSGGAAIQRVELTQLQPGQATLRLTAGDCQADLTVQKGQSLVEVQPVKGARSLEVRATSRYAVLPDFFGYDVVYDPRRFKGDVLPVAAENFLLNFVEGNRAIVMCVWPGTLTGAVGAGGKGPATQPAGREPAVDLLLVGQGPDRRIAGSRIEFLQGPIHVAVMEHEKLWHDQDVSGLKALEPIRLDWQRPFDAHWRLNMLVAEGKTSRDLISRSQSYRFLYAPADAAERKQRPNPDTDIEDKRAWVDRTTRIWSQGYPVVYEERVYSHIYPAWCKGPETYIALYADDPRKGAKENIFDRILIYPLDRDKAAPKPTPLEVYTFVDIMRQTLGQEPCAYVLDLEGIRGRQASGIGTHMLVDDATCTIWGGHIFPLLSQKELSPEKKAHLVQAVKDLIVFLRAVNDRIEEYAAFNERLLKTLNEARADERVKPLADSITRIAEGMKAMLAKYNLPRFKAELDRWAKDIAEMAAQVEAGNYQAAAKAGGTRTLGQAQDNAVSDCRRYVKALRQEASFADSDEPRVRKLAVAVRDLCQDILRNPHPKELGHTDPNSPRIGLTREQREQR